MTLDANEAARRLLDKAAEWRAWRATTSLNSSGRAVSEKVLRAELGNVALRPDVEALRTFLKERSVGVNCGVWLHRRLTGVQILAPFRYYRLDFRFLLFTAKGFEIAEKPYYVTTLLPEPWEAHFQELRRGAEVASPRYPLVRGLTEAHCRRMVQAGLTAEGAKQALEVYILSVLKETPASSDQPSEQHHAPGDTCSAAPAL